MNNEEYLQSQIINNQFELNCDINVDIKNYNAYIKFFYKIEPENKKFMCASILLSFASRIVWLAQSTQDYELINLLSSFIIYFNKIKIQPKPLNNKYTTLYSIGTPNKYNFNLNYRGFWFGGIFSKDISTITIYSFFALYKYFYLYILPFEKNEKFYKKLEETLFKIFVYHFDEVSRESIRQICMENSINIAFGDI